MVEEKNISESSNSTEKKKGKKAIRAFAFVFVVLFTVALLITSINIWCVNDIVSKAKSYGKVQIENQLVPQKDENGYWYFTTDEEFKVLHLTDVHLGGGFMSNDKDNKALNAVAAMVTREKPDLVIITGDIAFPVPVKAGTFNNKSAIKAIGNLMESLGVYWTVTFGNHDSESYSIYSREEVAEFYSSNEWEHCLFSPGPKDIYGECNHVIEVKNTDGIITQAFVMIDSNAYTSTSVMASLVWQYDNIHEDQIEWYRSEIERMNKENAEIATDLEYQPVKSLAFFHIPLMEMRNAWTELQDNNFADTENTKYQSGIIGEVGKRVYSADNEDNMFEAMLELGSTKGMFFGHDHYNNATLSYKDIVFSYGYSIDYLAYSGIKNEGSQRGCTLITVKPDTTFEIEKFNYYSDRYDLEGFTREDVTMQFDGVEYEVAEE
ncbi:MAG: metallophosphoesterase [Oscillospiraceae bacterium]|nr:metallophosphoesterase [Oscillospiraceae bacterium]